MIEIASLFNFMEPGYAALKPRCISLSESFIESQNYGSEQCIAFECDRFKKWKHMAAAEINGDWGQKKVMIAMMKTSRMRKNLSMSSLYLRFGRPGLNSANSEGHYCQGR